MKDLLLSVIWLIFTITFFYIAKREYTKSKQVIQNLEKFNVRPQGGTRFDAGFSPTEFGYEIRKAINESNKESHITNVISFSAAGLTALLSFVISLLDIFFN